MQDIGNIQQIRQAVPCNNSALERDADAMENLFTSAKEIVETMVALRRLNEDVNM